MLGSSGGDAETLLVCDSVPGVAIVLVQCNQVCFSEAHYELSSC